MQMAVMKTENKKKKVTHRFKAEFLFFRAVEPVMMPGSAHKDKSVAKDEAIKQIK